MRMVLFCAAVPVTIVIAAGCGAARPAAGADVINRSGTAATAAALAEFRQRIDRYMEMRREIVAEVPEAQPTADPALLRARENALAGRIVARRANARHGDIFTPVVRPVFRRLVRAEIKGEQGRDINAKLDDDAPAPGAVPLEVNAKYPAGVPFPTTPAPILLALPTLPRGLEYRIVEKDLVLLDQPADVILDYIRNIVP